MNGERGVGRDDRSARHRRGSLWAGGGIAAKQAGIDCVLLDRRTIVSTIDRYPLAMTFFSTPERIEIGDIPFIASHEKPTRQDGLIYYRRVAEHYGLDVRPGEDVVDVTTGAVRRLHAPGSPAARSARPTRRTPSSSPPATTTTRTSWVFPAKTCPMSTHYFVEGHPYWHQRVIVIGAGNSSVDAALECWRAGATVTLVHFGEGFDRTVKAWVLPGHREPGEGGKHRGALALAGSGHHADPRRSRVGSRPARWR